MGRKWAYLSEVSDLVATYARVAAAYDQLLYEVQVLLWWLAVDGFDAALAGSMEIENRGKKYNYKTLFELPKVRAASKRKEPKEALREVLLAEIQATSRRYAGSSTSAMVSKMLLEVFGLDPEEEPHGKNEDIILFAMRRQGGGVQYFMQLWVFKWLSETFCSMPGPEGSDAISEAQRDVISELIDALKPVMRRGLPVTQATMSPPLAKHCLGVDISGMNQDELLAVAAELDAYVCHQLDIFEIDYLAEPARILFGHVVGGKVRKVSDRRARVAKIYDIEPETIRRHWQARIVEALAWQIYRSRKLQQSVG